MTELTILPYLPATGPMPVQFSANGRGKHREGIAVRVRPATGEGWLGNFQPGLSKFSAGFDHSNGQDVVIIAGGTAYVVDPIARKLRESFGGGIEWALPIIDLGLLVHNGLWFTAVGQAGQLWESERISWDGMQGVRWGGNRIVGEAWDAVEDRWRPFSLDPYSGRVEGGAPSAPPR